MRSDYNTMRFDYNTMRSDYNTMRSDDNTMRSDWNAAFAMRLRSFCAAIVQVILNSPAISSRLRSVHVSIVQRSFA
jgi:hypothetical protein